MKFRENEDAVSPVIGVILMVAITVILAAVIAAFVFGMGSDIGTTKTVAVTASQNGEDVILTYHGGADAASLDYLKVEVISGDSTKDKATYYTQNDGTFSSTTSSGGTSVEVGMVMKVPDLGSKFQDHVVVIGHFADGSDHVVLDTYV